MSKSHKEEIFAMLWAIASILCFGFDFTGWGWAFGIGAGFNQQHDAQQR